jgi:hypothetical protein
MFTNVNILGHIFYYPIQLQFFSLMPGTLYTASERVGTNLLQRDPDQLIHIYRPCLHTMQPLFTLGECAAVLSTSGHRPVRSGPVRSGPVQHRHSRTVTVVDKH